LIAVTTPTGKIGSELVPLLLAAGEKVRVIARDPRKLSARFRNEVEVTAGSPDNPEVTAAAFDGVEAVFLVVPFPFSSSDILKDYMRFVRPAAEAIRRRGVKRLVFVSGLRLAPADAVSGSPLATEIGNAIEETGSASRALWCAGFMENLLTQIEALKRSGTFFQIGHPDVKTPLVATRDIAATAARLLLDRSWSGRGGVGVLGPEDLSYNDMARIMSEVLGTPIRFQQIGSDAFKAQFVQAGGSSAVAQWLVEMRADSEKNPLGSLVRTAENTTSYTFRQWCEEVLKPAMQK